MVEIRRPKKSYQEHRKAFAAAKGRQSNLGETKDTVTAEAGAEDAVGVEASPKPPAASPVRELRQATRPKRAADGADKVRLKFTLPAPMPGASAYFDRAVALMGDGKALRLVLARAFDEIEAAVDAGEEVVPGTYPVDPTRSANTSRHVSVALYVRAKQTLDPMDLLPPGSFGRELAMAALARFLRFVA